ncbi:MAG: hypothetical protein P1U39_04735 [Legionellaceae bacterium]|nr:hypothetical protein [Legionellaceae bacterium]
MGVKLELIKKIWADVYNPNLDTEKTIREYFSPNYTQEINGVHLSLTPYIEHVVTQKQSMSMKSIDYLSHLEDRDRLFAIYIPKAIDDEGNKILAEVIAKFVFDNNKINHIHGQVRFLSGSSQKLDM